LFTRLLSPTTAEAGVAAELVGVAEAELEGDAELEGEVEAFPAAELAGLAAVAADPSFVALTAWPVPPEVLDDPVLGLGEAVLLAEDLALDDVLGDAEPLPEVDGLDEGVAVLNALWG
jgi:hypothetical protein